MQARFNQGCGSQSQCENDTWPVPCLYGGQCYQRYDAALKCETSLIGFVPCNPTTNEWPEFGTLFSAENEMDGRRT
jgi:hypothetical protein